MVTSDAPGGIGRQHGDGALRRIGECTLVTSTAARAQGHHNIDRFQRVGQCVHGMPAR